MSHTYPQTKRNWKLHASFAALIILAVASQWAQFHYIYGFSITLTSLFVLLSVRLHGLWRGLVCAVAANAAGVLLFSHSWFTLLGVGEALVVGLLLRRYRGRLFGSSVAFWALLGLPVTYVLHSHTSLGSSGALHIAFLFAVIGLFNSLFAEILHQYLPLQRWIGQSKAVRMPFSFGQLIIHFSLAIVFLSFLLNTFVNSLSSLTEVSLFAQQTARQTADDIMKPRKYWDSATGLFSSYTPAFNDIQYSVSSHPSDHFTISIMDSRNQVVASNVAGSSERYIHAHNRQTYIPINESFYLSTPSKKFRTLQLYTWQNEHFLYLQPLPEAQGVLVVEAPLSNYEEYLFKKYFSHIMYWALFTIITVAFALLITRTFARSLQKLAASTRNLPLKLKQNNAPPLPRTSLIELHSLIANFKHMSGSLLHLFRELQKGNEQLSAQAHLLQQSEERLHQLAYYDSLTELPNRLQFTRHFQQLIDLSSGHNRSIAVLFIDINRFKQVNDTLGHAVGDELLRLAAGRFTDLSSKSTSVFRLSGDEFVFLHCSEREEDIESVAKAICDSFSAPFVLEGMSLYLTLSVGISVYPQDGHTIDTITRNADIAMYNAKEEGRGCYRFFRPNLVFAMAEKMQLENGLYRALQDNQFSLYYQPKISAATGEMSGIEALIRWHHPELGLVPPDKFIPLAEESGFILEIDGWVFREACRQNKAWQDEGLQRICVSVNISARHFYQGNLKEMIVDALRDTGLEPQYVSLEITEGVLMRNLDHVIETIGFLRDLGIQISIDDFGTGYSSLNQLQRLPISDVKLDRSFIQGITSDDKKSSIVKAIIELVHSMNMKVVAEGVETQDESQFCKELKCDELQGYLFSRPLPAAQLRKLLRPSH